MISLAQNYKFLNVPDEKVREEYTSNKNIGLGWYYIKKMDVTAHVVIRCGGMSCGSDLTDAVGKGTVSSVSEKEPGCEHHFQFAGADTEMRR